MSDLFESYGGKRFIARVAFAWYDRVLECEILAPYFAGHDMRRLVEHQTKFLATLDSGIPSHTDEELREAHAPHRVSGPAFDRMIDLLDETFSDFSVTEADRGKLRRAFEARRRYIVTLPAKSSASA